MAMQLYRGGGGMVPSGGGGALAVRAQTGSLATRGSGAVGPARRMNDPNIIDAEWWETRGLLGGGGGGRGGGGGQKLLGSGGGGGAMVPYKPPGGGGGGGGADIFNFKTGGDASWLGGMMDNGGMQAAFSGALIGGTASYATGGEFGAGALAGGSMAFGARAIHQSLQANSKFLSKGIQQAAGGEGMKAKAAQMVMNNQSSIQTVQQRHAMMAGAGLFGVVGGGERNRNNHRRGFNAHRGNAF